MKRGKYLPADERRAVTVATVVELAGVQNPDSITTAAIAKSMNVTQGSLFRHFPNKEGIWLTVIEWVSKQLGHRIDSAIKDIKSPILAIEAMFLAHVSFVAEHPGVPRLIIGELHRADATPAKKMIQALLRRYRERLGRLIQDGKSQGELSATLDHEAAAIAFVGAIQGLVMQSLLADDTDRIRRDAPRVLAIFLRGIREA